MKQLDTGPPGNAAPWRRNQGGQSVDLSVRHSLPTARPHKNKTLSRRADKDKIRRLRLEYQMLSEVQAPLERAFWRLEQRKAQLADQLANEGVAPFCRPRRGGCPPSKRKRPKRKVLTRKRT